MARPSPPLYLAPRAPDSHKGTYGHCLLVGGSPGMSGAIALAGLSALRSGAGLVTVATTAECANTVAAMEPCYMTVALPLADPPDSNAAQELLLTSGRQLDAWGCGPGLGCNESAQSLAVWLYQSRPEPLVLDADGLNALSSRQVSWSQHAGPRVLTPHPGEFRRMTGLRDASVPELRQRASAWAGEQNVVLVLKSHRTLVTDGTAVYENQTGNPGMATGGTGDVLTGILTSLLAQGLAPFNAARLATYVHGLAGDLAAEKLGMISLIARDLIEYLPCAFQDVVESPRSSIGFVP